MKVVIHKEPHEVYLQRIIQIHNPKDKCKTQYYTSIILFYKGVIYRFRRSSYTHCSHVLEDESSF
jgi:hypothetical protein